MTAGAARPATRSRQRGTAVAIVLAASVIAALSARPYAGSWNDGSRLAAVESLVDRHTWAIDDSIFVRVPAGAASPYRAGAPVLAAGTKDKLRIDGRFYSDKSPVPTLLLATWYAVLRGAIGLDARTAPGRFVFWMTLGSVGVAYVVTVWSGFRLAATLGLPRRRQLVLTASLGLGSVALPYARHVNQHALLLAVGAVVAWLLADTVRREDGRRRRVVALGTLAGLGYTIDLGAGPVLFAATAAAVGALRPLGGALAVFAAAAAPWLALHHGLTWVVAGTVLPANSVAAYLDWPGSPFSAANMTGTWHHRPLDGAVYAAALLLGKRGFLGHNPPLLLAVLGAALLLRGRDAPRPLLWWAIVWSVGTWLLYAATSNNSSGVCASVRWFVPLLAPGYLVLALLLHARPWWWPDFTLLATWGLVLGGCMWWEGPWRERMIPGYWPIQVAVLGSWLYLRRRTAWGPTWKRRSKGAGLPYSRTPSGSSTPTPASSSAGRPASPGDTRTSPTTGARAG